MKRVGEIIPYFRDKLKLITNEREVVSWAYMIISHVLGYNRSQVILNSEEYIKEEYRKNILEIIDVLSSNTPIQYALGFCEFLGCVLNLNKNVLIPRPETEELVAWILEEEFSSALDIGTGSGCIAIALSKHAKSEVSAIEVCSNALIIAKENAILNNVEVEFLEKDILKSNINRKFDLVVSNPPYILEESKNIMSSVIVDNEPHLALFVPDTNPLLFYKRIIDISTRILNARGNIFFEINENYGESIKEILVSKGFVDIELKKDINDRDRMIKAVWK